MLPVVRLPRELFEGRFPSVLRERCRPVERFDDALRLFVAELWETVDALGGGGLAAPQVGVPLRVVVLDVRSAAHPLDAPAAPLANPIRACLVNPEVLSAAAEVEVGVESCYSLPGYCGLVPRPPAVAVAAHDEHGRRVRLDLDGFPTRVALHELDHLDGILYSDLTVDRLKRAPAAKAEA